MDNYLTVSQAAVFLGVSASTLRNWDKAGKLKARRHPMNGYRLYEKRELERLLREIGNQSIIQDNNEEKDGLRGQES